MENKNRLTESDDLGNWGIKGLLWKNLYEGEVITREIHEKLYGCLAKLKDYEETELSPEEVEDGSLYIRLAKRHGTIGLVIDECIQYEEIGTVEEFKALKEKSVAKKPDYEGDGYYNGEIVLDTWICPNCEKHYEVDYDDYEYCPNCGKHIDHSGLTEDD